VVGPTTTVAMTGPLVKTDTETTAIGKTAHRSAETVPGRHLVGLNMKIVAPPGLRPPGGRLMIEGLQGTMITGEGAMMIAEALIIMLTAAGTMATDAGTIEDATRRMNDMKKGQGTQTEMAVGLVKLVVIS
jgi:hypothetical protein